MNGRFKLFRFANFPCFSCREGPDLATGLVAGLAEALSLLILLFFAPLHEKESILLSIIYCTFALILKGETMTDIKLNTIPEAIAAIKNGEFIIVVDDEDRENEGDLIIAAECITPEKINFMETHARGLICAPITYERCEELELPMMVTDNTSMHADTFHCFCRFTFPRMYHRDFCLRQGTNYSCTGA